MEKVIKVLAVLCMWCIANTSPTYPIQEIPFDVAGVTGESILNFTIRKEDDYAVQLSYLFDAENPSSRKQVWKTSGGELPLSNGRWAEAGAPFDLETIVTDAKSGTEVHRSSVSHPKLTSWGRSALYAEICRVVLKKGRYKLQVRRIGSSSDLAKTGVNVSVVEAYHGK